MQYTSSELLMTIIVQPICFDLGKIVYDLEEWFLSFWKHTFNPTVHICGHIEVATGNKAEPDWL